MLLNYLKLAIRLFLRNPFFSIINVAGLSVGFTAFFILWQHSLHEMKSDQFHRRWQDIVRLNFHVNDGVFNEKIAVIHPAFTRQIATSLPELSDHTRLGFQNEFNTAFTGDHGKEISLTYINPRNEKAAFKEDKLVYADQNIFDFFTIEILSGDRETFLNEPNCIVLSDKLAHKYFANEPAVGATLLLNDSLPLLVTGVYKSLPANSHLDFEAVLPIKRIEKRIEQIELKSNAWFTCYFRLPEHVNRELLTTKIEGLKVDLLTKPFDQFNWTTTNWKAQLQPLAEIAFEKVRGDDFIVKSKLLLTVFGAIAVVVLLMAWVNFINMTITASSKRVKELVARLGVGARPGQLIVQFVIEAAVVNFISLSLAITLVQLLKTPSRLLLSFNIPEWKETSAFSLWIIAIFLFSGVLFSGIYPALITLKRTPGSLFGGVKMRSGHTSLSYWMTISQFSMAVVLIIWAFAVYGQMNFILNKNLGFRKDNVVVVDLPYLASSSFANDLRSFLNRIRTLDGIGNYAVSTTVAGDNEPLGIAFKQTESGNVIGAASDGGVDDRFLGFYEIELLAGRNFLPDHPSDKNSIIVSRKVLKKLDVQTPEEAIGRKLIVLHPEMQNPAEIIGVIEDYNRMPLIAGFQSYWSDDMGVALIYGNHLLPEKRSKKVSIRINSAHFDKTISQINTVYEESFQGNLFNWYLLDQHINRHYQNDKIIRNQILLFTCLTIGIACLGLLGMVSYKAVEKNKEIGIRKILGAQLHQIAGILLNTTIRQISIAMVIGIPIAYYLVQLYKANFVAHIAVQWWHYLLPLVILMLILISSILVVVWKAARTNPVEALRYE